MTIVKDLKILFFGTSMFAVPALNKLKEAGYEIVGVVTQPDKPVGRKQELVPSPVKVAAQKLGIQIFQPTSPLSPPQAWGGIKGGVELMKDVDLFVVASYGKIIPKAILDIPKYGVLNIHPSLLPKYRGASPIHAAILNGDTETGVTIIKMDEELDHGPIVASTKLQITNHKPQFEELHDQLAEIGADLLIRILPDYISGKIKPTAQDHDKATYTKIITKDDARVDWNKSAEEIERMVRAYHKWPVAWTTLDGKRLKVYEAESIEAEHQGYKPGQVIITSPTLRIMCGKGVLVINEVQLEGRDKMPAEKFVRGYNLAGKILK